MKSSLFAALFIFVVFSNKLYAQSTLCFTSASDNIIRTSSGARSVAVNDFNGDNIPDVVVTNLSTNVVSILIGQGDRSFRTPEIVAQISQPLIVVSEDFNNDGKPDLAVSAVDGPLTILLGDGTGRFEVLETYDDFEGATILKSTDFNGDGKKDLVGYLNGTSTIVLKQGDGTGKFLSTIAIEQVNNLKSIATADFSGDNVADIVFISLDKIMVATSDATGTITKTEAASSPDFQLVNADFNNDGKQDLYLPNTGKLLLGNGVAAFPTVVNAPILIHDGTMEVGKFNDDDLFDVAAIDFFGTVSILYATSGTTFDPAVAINAGNTPIDFVLHDIDDDGREDFIVAEDDSNGGVLIMYNEIDHYSGSENYNVPSDDFGLLTADVNNDGLRDIITTYDTAIFAMVQNVDGTFETVTSIVDLFAGERVTGDFNGDGKIDVASTSFNNGNIRMFVGDGTGSFTDGTVYSYNSRSIASADFNNDGELDLVVDLYSTNFIKVMINNGAGGFTSTDIPVNIFNAKVRTGDFNNDGKIDIAAVTENDNKVVVVPGNGNGTFAPPTNFATGTTIRTLTYFADLNGDGKSDIIIADTNLPANSFSVLINTGTSFTLASNVRTEVAINTITHGLFDSDNLVDIAVGGAYLKNVLVYSGNGNGTFGTPAPFATGSTHLLIATDLNNDGTKDLVASGMYTRIVNILRNNTARITTSGNITGCTSNINLSAPAFGYNYQWSTPSGSAFGQTIPAPTRGTYTLTIFNYSEQCRTISEVDVEGVPSLPVANLINTTCVDETGSVIVESQVNTDVYSFDNGDTFQEENFKGGLTPGEYKIIIQNDDGCNSEALTVTMDPQPTPPTEPEISVIDPSCSSHTGSITVTIQKEGDTYSFDNGITYQGTNVKTGMIAGEYQIMIRRSIGCISDTTEAVVNQGPEIPSKPVISTVVGTDGALILQSTPAVGYEWSKNFVVIPGAFAQVYDVIETGLYTVVVLSEDGCKSESSEPYSAIISGDIDDNPSGFYPNPAESYIHLKTTGKSIESAIYTAIGQRISISPTQTPDELVYDVRHLSEGVYVLKVTIDGYAKTIRWVKR